MNETKWKQVSAAECVKWQIDNPMKEAAYGSQQSGRQRTTTKPASLKSCLKFSRNGFQQNIQAVMITPTSSPEVTE